MSWRVYCGSGRTNDSLRAGRSAMESRSGLSGRPHRPQTHPVSCTIDIGSFPGVKRPKCGADHTPPSGVALRVVGAVRPPPLFAFTFSYCGIGLYSRQVITKYHSLYIHLWVRNSRRHRTHEMCNKYRHIELCFVKAITAYPLGGALCRRTRAVICTGSGVTRGGVLGFSNPPPRNSEDIGGVLDRISKKNRRLDFHL